MSFSDPIQRYEGHPRLDDFISVYTLLQRYLYSDDDGVDHLKREFQYASHG